MNHDFDMSSYSIEELETMIKAATREKEERMKMKEFRVRQVIDEALQYAKKNGFEVYVEDREGNEYCIKSCNYYIR